jgi:RNase H-like domain found in reverse transcriptase
VFPDFHLNNSSFLRTGIFHNILHNLLPEIKNYSPMHKSGFIHLQNDNIHLQTVLFDSGAIQSNYIDEQFVNDNIVHLQQFLQPLKHSVKLGDNKTHLQLTHIITITVSFIDSTLKSHKATINCSLMSMPGTTLIIGLPTILFHFFDLFTDLLRQAQKSTIHTKKQTEVSLSSSSSLSLSSSSLINTWTLPQDIIAPEDTETPQPCSFTGPLYYLGKPYLEAVQQYKDLISTHVSTQFLSAAPELLDFLSSDLALSVFVPQQWTGITGIPPIDLQFSDQLPLSLRPKARPVNPSLYDNAEKEFKRLQTYFYVPSDSSIASCLVIAPKSTAPFIRLCGDYVTINKYINTGHYYIPNVQQALTKASGFSIFIDLDWTNSFHQIPISQATSNRLSIQTPWGLVRPIFVPEGIGPASGILQKCVMDIFSDFDSWTIAIFDNLLILAHSYSDAYEKFRTIIQRCNVRHVVLKFSKSWMGFDTVTFFGYLVRKGTFEMSNERKMAISNIQMPSNIKLMQRFLGTALFFQRFLPNYSEITAPFHDMTTAKFDWNPLTWTIDYNSLFLQFKTKLMASVALHFPDYSLSWILRSDASSIACAAVLLQVTTTGVHQPLAFLSKKFSDSALNWDIHKKEAYAVFYGVHKLEFLLRPKEFVLETDHANLLYMENNTAPIITRWRIYLQSFNTK